MWARAFSTGDEDNGIRVGLNGDWPESGQRLHLCKGKNQWTRSSQQRVPDNHCGTPFTIWLDIEKPGIHVVTVSMREDGFELDKLILSRNANYTPEGLGPTATRYQPKPLEKKDQFHAVESYRYLWKAISNFQTDEDSEIPFYVDKKRKALAINASKTECRDRFARASVTMKHGSARDLDLHLVTLTEIDGESEYRVFINDQLKGSFVNPSSDEDYKETHFVIEDVSLAQGDVISGESNAVTNGKIPEGDGTAFSRGRWIGVLLQ